MASTLSFNRQLCNISRQRKLLSGSIFVRPLTLANSNGERKVTKLRSGHAGTEPSGHTLKILKLVTNPASPLFSRSACNTAQDKLGVANDGFPHLPQLPSAPPYPCPFLTSEEIQTYLVPLYARRWSVESSSPGTKPAPELVKRFIFSTPEDLEEFLVGLQAITESENHHALQEPSQEPPSIVLKVHTHSGLRPPNPNAPNERRRDRVQPGITLRDIRFAYLVDSMLVVQGDAKLQLIGTSSSSNVQPLSADEVEAWRYGGPRG